MNKTLIAKKQLFYRHRALTAGQTFEASPIDAQYLIARGQATDLPAPDSVAPPEPPPVAHVEPVVAEVVEAAPVEVEAPVAEPAAEAAAEPVAAEPVAAEAPESVEPATPARRPYTRRRNASTAAE